MAQLDVSFPFLSSSSSLSLTHQHIYIHPVSFLSSCIKSGFPSNWVKLKPSLAPLFLFLFAFPFLFLPPLLTVAAFHSNTAFDDPISSKIAIPFSNPQSLIPYECTSQRALEHYYDLFGIENNNSTLDFSITPDMINDGFAAMAMPLQLAHTISASAGDIVALTSLNGCKKEERIPQWGYQETKDFIAIRAELEKDFTQTKRNKTLWEIISSKIRERGHRRNAEQCKCKWKNLVNRYKGKETLEIDNGRPSPFYEELHAIFTERAKNMDRLLLESETGSRPKKKARKGLPGEERSSEEFSEEDDDEDEESGDERLIKSKKRKVDRERQRVTAEKCRANSMQEVLEDFFHQQQRIEMQWRDALEKREQERRLREQEWRQTMENLEKERMIREQVWREREEQRKVREEARAEKRDVLFTALLTRLAREEL